MGDARGAGTVTAPAWPPPKKFDPELLEAEKDYLAKRSKATLGASHSTQSSQSAQSSQSTQGVQSAQSTPDSAGEKAGLREDKAREGVIAVKNPSSQQIFLVACSGDMSEFRVNQSCSHESKTENHADLKLTAKLPMPEAEVAAGTKPSSTNNTKHDWERRPQEPAKIITAQRLRAGERQLVGVGYIRNVYLHIFFDYDKQTKRWKKRMAAVPILPDEYFYNVTDELLNTDHCQDADLDYNKVMKDLPGI